MQFGNNAYGKPATALNILRETVMGRELFDFAYKTYAERWKFKHPTPADFFRTMEDASGVDLDWFWRGWFFTTDYVDIAIKNVEWFKVDTKNPNVEKAIAKELKDAKTEFIGDTRNKTEIKQTYNEKDPTINDFYNTYDPFEVTLVDEADYKKYLSKLDENDIKILEADYNYYSIEFENLGGLVMPVILNFTFKDGTNEVVRIPAEIWKQNDKHISKVFFFKKEVTNIDLDPYLETADVDVNNNSWPAKIQLSKFKLYKSRQYGWGADGRENPMQRDKRNEKLKKEGE
jgi:hypothetical protein